MLTPTKKATLLPKGSLSVGGRIISKMFSACLKITDLSQLADTIAAHFSFKIEDKQGLLETVAVNERFAHLLRLVNMEIEVFKMGQRIKGRVKD